MNKRTKKTKALHMRILAWVLCLVCLCAVVPTVAIATGDGVDTGAAAQADAVAQESAEGTLYVQALAAGSCADIRALLDNADTADVEALTYDELTAIIAYVETLADDGCKDALVEDLTVLRDGDAAVIPGWGGGDQGGWDGGGTANECDQSYYQSTAAVYWDTMTYNRTTMKGSSYAAGRSLVSSVTLTSMDVKQANATSPRSASGGTKMGTYFPGATTSTEGSSTLVITPAAGYYITDVVIACTGSGGTETAFNCNTWGEGNAFTKGFNVGTSGSVSITVSSKDFSHRSTSKKVFILIAVAPIPSPLYVEYWPGDITNYTDDAVFSDSDGWTTGSTGNVLGTGEVQTSDTQFKYAYTTNSTEAANWRHYANSITEDAKAAAANAGYYFTGWKVEYYTKCTATSTGNTDRAYTYAFSDSYGTGAAQPGDDVHLITNCKITALWAPIQLKVTKTVTGLSSISEFANKSNTYRLSLVKLDEDGRYEGVVDGGEVEYTITGDGTLTYTFAASGADVTAVITPGTYRVVERWYSDGCYDLNGSAENAYCTTSYPAETVVVVGTDGAVQELKVLNTYSSKPATYDLTVKKTLSGDMYSKTKKFAFTVTYMDADGLDQTVSFDLGMNEEHVITGISVGCTVLITEDSDGYTFTLGAGTTVDGATSEDMFLFMMPKEDVTVVFNNELNGDINTGVVLEALPYVLILAAAGVAALLLLRKRRYDDEV